MALTGIRRSLRTDGFSLIEVIFASALLTIGVMSVFNVMIKTNQQRTDSSAASMATVLASEKMEEYQSADFNSVVSQVEDYQSIAGFSAFRRETQVETIAGGELKKLSVIVRSQKSDKVANLATVIRR